MNSNRNVGQVLELSECVFLQLTRCRCLRVLCCSADSSTRWKASLTDSCLSSSSRLPRNDSNQRLWSRRWNVIVSRIVSRTSFRMTTTVCVSRQAGQIPTDILMLHISGSASYRSLCGPGAQFTKYLRIKCDLGKS